MDSIGDYFYLIILAVAGLSGLLKKKKETATSNPNPTSTKKTWEDVLRDLIPIEKEDSFETKDVVPQAVKKVPEPFLNFEATSDQIRPKDKPHATRFVDTFLVKEKIDDKKSKDFGSEFIAPLQLKSLDDAKRAFMYSEIFNRRY